MNPNIGPCIYRLYDAAGSLLYIGSSSNFPQRLAIHLSGHSIPGAQDIRDRYHRHEVTPCESMEVALRLESAAILDEAPELNRKGNPARWRNSGGRYVPVDAPDYKREPSALGLAMADVVRGVLARHGLITETGQIKRAAEASTGMSRMTLARNIASGNFFVADIETIGALDGLSVREMFERAELAVSA